MALRALLMAGLATSAAATKLLVTSYAKVDGTNGTVLSLDLTPGFAQGKDSASLRITSEFSKMGPQPTWLDLTLYEKGILITLDESWATPDQGVLYTLKKSANGSFEVSNTINTLGGPVTTQFYNKNTAMAVSDFAGGAIQTFKVSPEGAFTLLQTISYGSEGHGPGAGQTTSHVHQAIIDPTGEYLVFPDLGLDSVHVFCIDSATGNITAHEDLKVETGSGPRHGAFAKIGNATYFYLIHEINNTLVSFKVNYLSAGGLSFTKVDTQSTYGNKTEPFGAAAEVQISPDSRFLLASNRNVTLANIPNPDPTNSTQVPSDSIATFSLEQDGKLKFVQLAPSGGKFPRHFSLNKKGNMVAVANQASFNVDIWERDTETGKLGAKISSAWDLPGNPNMVQFVEEY